MLSQEVLKSQIGQQSWSLATLFQMEKGAVRHHVFEHLAVLA